MKILLDEKESAAYLKNREREAILEYTSRFPPGMQKTKPLPMTDSQRSDIRKMHDDGMTPKEMAEILKLPVARVSGLIGSYCKRKVIRVPGDGTSHEDVAIPKESSELVPMEPTTRQDRIDAIILSMARKGAKYVTIASEVNNQLGGQLMPNDVADRLAELRGGKS